MPSKLGTGVRISPGALKGGKTMKKPKAPLKPHAPYKPVKPVEFFPAYEKKFKIDVYETTLADVLKATEGIDPKSVTFEASGDDKVSCSWPDPDAKPVPNPYYKQGLKHYRKELEKYNKAMEKYEKDLASYEERLKIYKEKNREYLAWYYKKQLEQLQEK